MSFRFLEKIWRFDESKRTTEMPLGLVESKSGAAGSKPWILSNILRAVANGITSGFEKEFWRIHIDIESMPASVSELQAAILSRFEEVEEQNRLESLIVFGEEECHSSRNPLTFLIVPKSINASVLTRLHEAFQASADRSLKTMVATRREMMDSCDVFPITFLRMKHHYRVLWGQDALEELVISDQFLRLRCEQEIRNILLRMQNRFLRYDDVAELRSRFEEFWTALQRSLRALYFLVCGEWPSQNSLLPWLVEEVGVSELVLSRSRQFFETDQRLEPDALQSLCAHLIETVAGLGQYVDGLQEPEAPIELFEQDEES